LKKAEKLEPNVVRLAVDNAIHEFSDSGEGEGEEAGGANPLRNNGLPRPNVSKGGGDAEGGDPRDRVPAGLDPAAVEAALEEAGLLDETGEEAMGPALEELPPDFSEFVDDAEVEQDQAPISSTTTLIRLMSQGARASPLNVERSDSARARAVGRHNSLVALPAPMMAPSQQPEPNSPGRSEVGGFDCEGPKHVVGDIDNSVPEESTRGREFPAAAPQVATGDHEQMEAENLAELEAMRQVEEDMS
jgi:hypothetical protein